MKYEYFVFAHPADKGKGHNSAPTVLYRTSEEAEIEAKRLAGREAGVRFCIGLLFKHFINTPEITEVRYNYPLSSEGY